MMQYVIDHFLSKIGCAIARQLHRIWRPFLHRASSIIPAQLRLWIVRPAYPLTDEQHEARKRDFVDSINVDAVCSLASQYNNSKPCRVFGTSNGSFNACFFVEFPDDGTRWVVRIPIEPAVHDVWTRLQTEVTTMRYIQSKTTIPIPRVHAFGRGQVLTRVPSTTQAYLILDYIPGQSLQIQSLTNATKERREHLYSQLVHVFAELRRLEFASAGSLMPDPRGGPEPVIGPLSSIQTNELRANGVDIGSSAVFTSATDYIHYQFRIMTEAYRLPVSEPSLETAQLEVFALEHLERQLPAFIDPRHENGPFVLCHLDLRWPNILVDEDLNILAIIDWEWTAAVPRQLFTPPYWLAGACHPGHVVGAKYREEFAKFYEVIAASRETSDAHRRLADEWSPDLLDSMALPVAQLLQHHSQLINVFYRALYPRLFAAPRKDIVPRFFERTENRNLALEVQRRMDISERYTRYLKANGLFVPSKEAEAARELARMVQELEQRYKSAR